MAKARPFGFSLIELMIVVAITGILAAIAYPNYQDYLRSSRRSDGYGALLTMANAQEKWFLDNNSYTSTLDNIWSVGQTKSLEDYYVLSAVSTGSGFTVRAIGAAGTSQARDTDCLCLTLDHRNNKAAFGNADCSSNPDTLGICWP